VLHAPIFCFWKFCLRIVLILLHACHGRGGVVGGIGDQPRTGAVALSLFSMLK
jgi:hypothetical protein